MPEITLSKTETKLLVEAAERGGGLELSDAPKASTRERTLGRLLRDGLITTGEAGHLLTPTGYRAVGLRPPRVGQARMAAPASKAPGTKQALVLQLLGRGEGASLAELVAATGWLPHTTRAVLSRLRSGGTALTKSSRPDGVTAYRIGTPEVGDMAPETEAQPTRKRGRASAEVEVRAGA